MNIVLRKLKELEQDEIYVKNKIASIESAMSSFNEESHAYKRLEVKKMKAEIKLFNIHNKLKGYYV